MRLFERDGTDLVTEIDEVEVALLASLVAQVTELIGGHPDAVGDDPFDQWAAELGAGGPQLDRSDPVVARLFPDAYADPDAAAEHRRLAGEGLRRARVADADVVLAGLAATQEGEQPLVIPADDLEAWAKTLNGVRLSLAMRLGIESEHDHEHLQRLGVRDPRSQLLALYDWLGEVLESLLTA